MPALRRAFQLICKRLSHVFQEGSHFRKQYSITVRKWRDVVASAVGYRDQLAPSFACVPSQICLSQRSYWAGYGLLVDERYTGSSVISVRVCCTNKARLSSMFSDLTAATGWASAISAAATLAQFIPIHPMPGSSQSPYARWPGFWRNPSHEKNQCCGESYSCSSDAIPPVSPAFGLHDRKMQARRQK